MVYFYFSAHTVCFCLGFCTGKAFSILVFGLYVYNLCPTMPDAWKITARLHALAFEIANEGTAPINRDELC